MNIKCPNCQSMIEYAKRKPNYCLHCAEDLNNPQTDDHSDSGRKPSLFDGIKVRIETSLIRPNDAVTVKDAIAGGGNGGRVQREGPQEADIKKTLDNLLKPRKP